MSDKQYERDPQISVSVSPALYKAIAAQSMSEGRSIASWLRRLAEAALGLSHVPKPSIAKYGNKRQRPAPRRRRASVEQAAPTGDSGTPDVAG